MITGNGMVATALARFRDRDDVLIFASGVSNSSESDERCYSREKNLLLSLCSYQERTLVYFSTCSVFDPVLKDARYIAHKREMEDLVRHNFSRHLVLRLPTLVGVTDNPYTFFSSFRNKIARGEELVIHRSACRYLMDVSDVEMIIDLFLRDSDLCRGSYNVAYDNPMNVVEIVKIMEEVSGKEAVKVLVDKGNCFDFDRSAFRNALSRNNFTIPNNYNRRIIQKYFNLKNWQD